MKFPRLENRPRLLPQVLGGIALTLILAACSGPPPRGEFPAAVYDKKAIFIRNTLIHYLGLMGERKNPGRWGMGFVQDPRMNAYSAPGPPDDEGRSGGRFFFTESFMPLPRRIQEVLIAHEVGHVLFGEAARGAIVAHGTSAIFTRLDQNIPGVGNMAPIKKPLVVRAAASGQALAADRFAACILFRDAKGLGKVKIFRDYLLQTAGESRGEGNYFDTHPVSKKRLAQLDGILAKKIKPCDLPKRKKTEEG